MPKSSNSFFDLLAINVCRASDALHAGSLAHAFSISALAAVHTGEATFAIFCVSLAFAFANASLRTIREAWTATLRDLSPPQPTAKRARRKKRNPSARGSPPSRPKKVSKRKSK
jgi:hypothetical protein